MKFSLESLRPYRGRIIASLIGLVIGILLLTIGFWRTLLLVLAVGIAYIIGMWKDGKFAVNMPWLPNWLG